MTRLRAVAFPQAIKFPFVRARMIVALAGLDHDLPADIAGVGE
ncbi:MAG TPA: hypothetical protein VFM75_07335 [Modicisalibacter sp.]|nr:hypothetical protein [Modicisalibacter sp.]